VLNTPRPLAYSSEAAGQFRAGIEQTVQRKLPTAERSYTAAITAAPSWPELYYNRALVFGVEGRPDRAIADFRKYLQLRPTASNHAEVDKYIDLLGRSPGGAMTRGIIFPGLGQIYTHRPLLGVVVMAGVAGGTVWGLTKRPSVETRTFTDPFGQEYSYQVTVQKRPNLVAGLATAGGIWLLGAIEASLHASHARKDLPLPSASAAKQRTAGRLEFHPTVAFQPTGPAFGGSLSFKLR
jgi:hypothetical protein